MMTILVSQEEHEDISMVGRSAVRRAMSQESEIINLKNELS